MLKEDESLKDLPRRVLQSLEELLTRVPALRGEGIAAEPESAADVVVRISVDGRAHTLACEVLANGQPRHVRAAALRLRDRVVRRGGVVPLVAAPYLSPDAQAVCREEGVGFLDLEGNAWLAFDSVFIERLVDSKPAAERRELKSLFKPKSARVLRVMLRDPSRAWRVVELAEAASVSLGHVSNVRAGLLDREWARADRDGLFLTAPDALLDSWRDAYEIPPGRRAGFYTTLHGGAFEQALRQGFEAARGSGLVVLASFSAAQWLAPYARTGIHHFYADEAGLEALRSALKLSTATRGENVSITLPKDEGVFLDEIEPASGMFCTSPVQTYLDLCIAGERGREAADHLRQEMLAWSR